MATYRHMVWGLDIHDYKAIGLTVAVSSTFAMIIYMVSLLSGSSALTAMVAFNLICSASLGTLVLMGDWVEKIYRYEDDMLKLTKRKKILEEETNKMRKLINSCANKTQNAKLFRECIEEMIGMKPKTTDATRPNETDATNPKSMEMDAKFKHAKLLIDIVGWLQCPITHEVPDDPVITSTGILYSSAYLNEHFRTSDSKDCPFTRQPIRWAAKVYGVVKICKMFRAFENE